MSFIATLSYSALIISWNIDSLKDWFPRMHIGQVQEIISATFETI